MAKRGRKPKVVKPVTYKVAVHTRELFRGLTLAKYLRDEYVTEKPSYATHWWDCTNGEWARWDYPPYGSLN